MAAQFGAVDWLLEEENPSVRYRTLTELLGEDPETPKIRQIKTQISASQPVVKLFDKMDARGCWLYTDRRTGRSYGDGVRYWDYVTTHFNLAFLSELGIGMEDPRLALAVNRYLGLQQPDGDFLGHFSCLFAYNIRSFVRMGFREDPRVGSSIGLMLATKRMDGGYLCDHHEGKYANRETKSCIRGSLKALVAFAELPELWNTARCKELAAYFLKRRVYFQSRQPDQPVSGEITSTIFPFVWRASFLEALYALSRMGYGQSFELQESWDLLQTKQDEKGRYVLDWVPPRSYFKPEKRGHPSKWVTLYAYLALKYRDTASPPR